MVSAAYYSSVGLPWCVCVYPFEFHARSERTTEKRAFSHFTALLALPPNEYTQRACVRLFRFSFLSHFPSTHARVSLPQRG